MTLEWRQVIIFENTSDGENKIIGMYYKCMNFFHFCSFYPEQSGQQVQMPQANDSEPSLSPRKH